MSGTAPKIFISYSHDSPEHRDRVLRFAQRLRKDGIDAQIDQYVQGRPPGGWPRWMLDSLDWADFVLLVCTETYYRRFRGHEQPHVGKGVDWEGQLITFEIYNAKSRTARFVPVIFRPEDRAFVPEPLSDHSYLLDSEDRYQELYGLLTGQASISLSELGPAKALPKKTVEPLTFGGPEQPAVFEKHHEHPNPLLGGAQVALRNIGGAPSNGDDSNQERQKEVVSYALISLISFLCGVGVLSLMIWNAPLLTRLGLAGNFYYLVLVPMGLAAAGFLFGVLHSYARYREKQLGGMLELGGPIVGFLLVVVLGFALVKPVTTFPLTVYVHGEAGPQDLVLRNAGDVLLDLGGDRRRQPIGADGQAYFPAIPATFQGQEVLIGVESESFVVSNPKQKHSLDGNNVYVSVQRKGGGLTGWVKDEKGNPIPGVTVRVAGLSKLTDPSGYFEFAIPGNRMQGELALQAQAPGYAPVNFSSVVPDANPLTIQLKRLP